MLNLKALNNLEVVATAINATKANPQTYGWVNIELTGYDFKKGHQVADCVTRYPLGVLVRTKGFLEILKQANFGLPKTVSELKDITNKLSKGDYEGFVVADCSC